MFQDFNLYWKRIFLYSKSYSSCYWMSWQLFSLHATITGIDDFKAIAETKINPFASIKIIASAFKNWFEDIFKIRSCKISGYWRISRASLKTIPSLGKSLKVRIKSYNFLILISLERNSDRYPFRIKFIL